MRILFLFAALFCFSILEAQRSVDLNMQYPPATGPFRNYSVYEPSSYKTGEPIALMFGFHPFNVGVWDAKSWRDELTDFAEQNDLLLICPDGGTDGRIDDEIDYDFSKALLDKILEDYVIEEGKVFAIGFSVGGKAVYEFGLKYHKLFKGFIPVGPAIDGVDFSDNISKSKCNAYYLVHGKQDNPNSRYYPMKSDLEDNGALVESILMDGVGHTFNFSNREQILRRAYQFIDTVSCNYSGINSIETATDFRILPSVVNRGEKVELAGRIIDQIRVYDHNGRLIFESESGLRKSSLQLTTENFKPGIHFVQVKSGKKVFIERLLVH